MANYYTGYSIAISVTSAEQTAWLAKTERELEELEAIYRDEPAEGSPEWARGVEICKTVLGKDFIFADHDEVDLPQLEVSQGPDGLGVVYMFPKDQERTNIEVICCWLSTFLRVHKLEGELEIEWASWADNPVLDGFCGGMALITAEGHEIMLTGAEEMKAALRLRMTAKKVGTAPWSL